MHMNAGIVQIYGYISDLSSATSIQLGLSKLKPVSSYVIIPFYNHQQPYTMIGSLWIKSTGEVTIYKPSNITQGYISGTFISE